MHRKGIRRASSGRRASLKTIGSHDPSPDPEDGFKGGRLTTKAWMEFKPAWDSGDPGLTFLLNKLKGHGAHQRYAYDDQMVAENRRLRKWMRDGERGGCLIL